MNKNIKSLFSAAVITLSLGLTSCTGDLNVTPINPNMNTQVDPVGLFNKCYANLTEVPPVSSASSGIPMN